MEVIKLTFIESPGLSDRYIRSYDTDLKNGMIDDALRRTRGSNTLGLTTVGRIAGSMVRPMGNAGRSHIEGGWGSNRLRFAMLVEVDARYHRQHLYITGYTDAPDYTERRDGGFAINHDMRMYFNSVTEVALLMSNHHGAETFRPKVGSHDQILNKRGLDSRADHTLMRPSDLFRRHSNAQMADLAARRVGGDNRFHNRIGAFSSNLSISTRRNNSPTSYLQRSISSYMQASEGLSDGGSIGGYDDSTNESQILDEVVDRLDENQLGNHRFFNDRLEDETNYFRQGYITYGELLRLSPEIDEDQMVGLRPLSDRDRDQFGASSSNRADTPENMAHEILLGSIPAIMLECMYSRVEKLVIDTAAMYEEDQVIPGLAMPFVDGLDTRSTDQLFIDRILQTVIPDITRNGAFQVQAEITCDIDGHIEMYISIDGGPEEFFADAVYADALASHVMSNSLDNLDRISSDILTVCSTFYQDRANRFPRDIPADRNDRDDRSTPVTFADTGNRW